MTTTPTVEKPAGAERPKKPGKQWAPTAGLAEVNAEIARLDLEHEVAELDAKGFVIVPEAKVFAPGFVDRMLSAILDIAEQESGLRPNLETGEQIGKGETKGRLFPFQDSYDNLLLRDRVFEELVMNETILALVTYLLGQHAELSNSPGVWLRGPVAAPPGMIPPDFVPPSLHSDNYGVPSPFAPYAQVCNATIAITEYSRAGGCLGFVPGSHKLMRHPLSTDELIDQWVPAECPPGSLIFWHGNTWHTIGNPRTIPGVRVSTSLVFCRPHMLPIKPIENVPQEVIDRNPPRFARLVGLHNRYKARGGIASNEVGDLGIAGAPSWWE